MNETEKHALRCETCGYYEWNPKVEECMLCNHPKFKDDIFMHEIDGVEFDRIEKMGCASHSKSRRILNTLAAIGKLKLLKERARKRSDEMLDMGHDGNWDGGKEEAFEIAIATICEKYENDLIKED